MKGSMSSIEAIEVDYFVSLKPFSVVCVCVQKRSLAYGSIMLVELTEVQVISE